MRPAYRRIRHSTAWLLIDSRQLNDWSHVKTSMRVISLVVVILMVSPSRRCVTPVAWSRPTVGKVSVSFRSWSSHGCAVCQAVVDDCERLSVAMRRPADYEVQWQRLNYAANMTTSLQNYISPSSRYLTAAQHRNAFIWTADSKNPTLTFTWTASTSLRQRATISKQASVEDSAECDAAFHVTSEWLIHTREFKRFPWSRKRSNTRCWQVIDFTAKTAVDRDTDRVNRPTQRRHGVGFCC